MLRSTGLLFLLLIFLPFSFVSCTEKPFSIDSVSSIDTAMVSYIQDIEFVQRGMALFVYSADLNEEEKYQIRVESPDDRYIWEKVLTPETLTSTPILLFNDLLMPGETPLPLGSYRIELINEEGTAAHVTLTRDRVSASSPEGSVRMNKDGVGIRITSDLPESVVWKGYGSVDGKSFTVSSAEPEIPFQVDTVEELHITYWDEQSEILITERLLNQSTLPTDL